MEASKGQYLTSDTQDVNTKFSTDVFIEKMKQNPVEAFNYVDQFRDSPYKQEIEEFRQMKQEAEVSKFIQAHPEFPGGQAAHVLNKIREELGQPMTKVGLEVALNHAIQTQKLPDYRIQQATYYQTQNVLNYLAQNGVEIPEHLLQGSGYRVVPQNNVSQEQPLVQGQGPQQQSFNFGQQQQRRQGIPTIGRNNAPVNQTALDAAENMNLDDLTKFFKKQGIMN